MDMTILYYPLENTSFLWGVVPGSPKKTAGTPGEKSRNDSLHCPGSLVMLNQGESEPVVSAGQEAGPSPGGGL
jgi:hypothetical protein